MLGLLRGNDDGWTSPTILSLLIGAVVMLAAFVVIERRVAEPMLPLELFRNRAFTGVQLAAFAVSVSLFALFLYLTLYLQNYLGYSPLQGGAPLSADHTRAVLRRAGRGRADGATPALGSSWRSGSSALAPGCC